MASWKEKGVVPDSDEEDQADSQSLCDEAQPHNPSQGSVDDQKIGIWMQRDDSEVPENVSLSQSSLESSKTRIPLILGCGDFKSYAPSLSPRLSKHTSNSIISQELPSSRRDLQLEQLRVDEEICQSYVTLSSPLSSLPSSPLQSHISQDGEASERSAPQQIDHQEDFFADEIGLEAASSDVQSVNRRYLRERNPIQLHPYALEGEKYRRTLLARGMRPLRLAHTQDATTSQIRLEVSPDPDFVSEESQGLRFEDEMHPSPSSSHESTPDVRNSLPIASNNLDPSNHSDDDEFPELSKLLTLPRGTRTDSGSTSGKTTHSSQLGSERRSKLVRPTISTSQMRLHALVEESQPPLSSPATSSPMPVFDVRDLSRRGATSSNLTSFSSTPVDATFELDVLEENLSSPLTDPTKEIVDLTTDNVDENDPFASDTSSESSSSDSEDAQSVQVRRVAKRIRGVLPASWLRLDQQTQNNQGREKTNREHCSPSPAKTAGLRGVAVRRQATSPKFPRKSRPENISLLQSDESDGDDDPYIAQGMVGDPIRVQDSDRSFFNIDVDSMEDDHIDAMFPAKRRQTRPIPDATRRKRQAISTSLLQRRTEGHVYQPKITSHLTKSLQTELGGHDAKRRKTLTGGAKDSKRAKNSKMSSSNRKVAIPNLSILDVLDDGDVKRRSLPPFLRIAARNARRRGGLGRQSPTRKFIKLSNKDDTLEAQSILRGWREGLIRPRPHPIFRPGSRIPVARVINYSQERAAPDNISFTAMASASSAQTEIMDKLTVSTPKRLRHVNEPPAKSLGRTSSSRHGKASKATSFTARPAQLEMSLLEYGSRHPSIAFGSTKKTFDTLYKRTHKGSILRGDVQLARYLGHGSRTQVEGVVTPEPNHKKQAMPAGHSESRIRRPRKQVPTRIDASAAVFRQPSEPLILELLQAKPETEGEYSNAGKLVGLGGFRTAYTYHFNIFSLPEGTFFHESTFIGSGRLQKALGTAPTRDTAGKQRHLLHRIGDQNLRWGPWNATISSELGLCIDWITEQVEFASTESSTTATKDILGCLGFIIDYTLSSLSFPEEVERKHCLCRFAEVLQIFVERQKVLCQSQNIEKPIVLQLIVELSTLTTILVCRILRLCHLDPVEPEISRQLEGILQDISAHTVALLLLTGLDAIRKLYDDLQYLSMREGGIKADRYAAHSWVVLIHVLQAAQLPRTTFWDVVNSGIFSTYNVESNDAKVLERIWYSMFSLLPLFDFDRTGVTGSRMGRSTLTANWALPQRLLRKIFELYATKSRQSPSFNDYLRALFNRCSHLVQVWGWRKHGQIVGTLFDFFAKHNLAHIRNEEVYQSPRFLGELHLDPSLEIEPSDRCFHILLKIIVVSIRQMYASKDVKGIRNIVTRVLPNHDRRYPKEQNIHQRDLASLRNHHDLLCTLFWAAPPNLRPTVGLIRSLIDPANSHKEAYLIHLTAWHNLARFVLASTPTREEYLPLDTWQSDLFSQLISQYKSAKGDAEQQLRQLSSAAKRLVSEDTVDHIVKNNQNQIMATISVMARLYIGLMNNVSNMTQAQLIFGIVTNPVLVFIPFATFIQSQQHSEVVITMSLTLINTYIEKLNEFMPPVAPNPNNQDEDSQDYGSDIGIDYARVSFIGELNGEIFTGVTEMLRAALHTVTSYPKLLDMIVTTWANIAGALIMTGIHTVSDYISESGAHHEIDMNDQSSQVREQYIQFLVKLVNFMGPHFSMQGTGRDALSDWLSILARPVRKWYNEKALLRHFACSDPIIERLAPEFQQYWDLGSPTPETVGKGMILLILREMQKELVLEPTNRSRYQAIIQRLLTTVEQEFRDLDPVSSQAKEYEEYMGKTLEYLSTYFRDLCPIDEFVKTARLYPTEDDPRNFVLTLRNYALRLKTNRGRSELNHYCYSFAKQAAVANGLKKLQIQLISAMEMDECSQQWDELVEHFLTALVPAFCHTAFVSSCGWLLAEPLLQVASAQLESVVLSDKGGALRGAGAIAATIVNGLWISSLTYKELDDKHVDWKVPFWVIYALLPATKFMIRALKLIGWTGEEPSPSREGLKDCLVLFNHFALGAREYLMSPLRAYVKVLRKRRGTSNDSHLTEGLIKTYTLLGNGQHELNQSQDSMQQQALKKLAEHCVCLTDGDGDDGDDDDDDDLLQIMNQLEFQHTMRPVGERYVEEWAIFSGLREAANTDEGKSTLQDVPAKNMPEFSAVILQDMQQLWDASPDEPSFRITLGRTTHDVNMTDADFGNAAFPSLLDELKKFLHLYEKMFKASPRINKDERQSARLYSGFDTDCAF